MILSLRSKNKRTKRFIKLFPNVQCASPWLTRHTSKRYSNILSNLNKYIEIDIFQGLS